MRITGQTRIMFILADAVGHIVGSDVLNRAFEEMELNVAVSPLSVGPDDLADMLAMIRRIKNVAGFGVTIPHKIAATALVDDLTDAARDIGAVNFVRRNADGSLTGHNIDGEGFLAGLAEHQVAVRDATVLQVGAGGVGRAIAFALAGVGARDIHLVNRDKAKAEELATAIRARGGKATIHVHASEDDVPAKAFDLVVNATSLGMHDGDPLPLSPSRLGPSTTVAEVIMTPVTTPILAQAQAIGCRTVPGMAMMQPQPLLVARFLGLAA
ncbi:shikimate dehydrogenase [Mesorhizobium sp. CAU 1741]|uniref:shikimate dehydrogenase family protein n=1 Tax=Mesorhizobium sp. CAU 1741 TaxID=3140366 RepID=UPI00325AF9E5